MSLRIVLHCEIPEDPKLRRQWNNVALQMETVEVFYTCEWALAMQSAYRSSLRPLLFLGYDGGDLVGVAPLATDAAGEKITFLAGTTADYCDFLTQPERRSEFVDAVFAELKKARATFIVLANLPEDSATSAALRVAAEKYDFHFYMRPAYLCAQVKLGTAAQRTELKTTLMRKRKIRRCLKAMEREGPVTIAHLQSWAQLQSVFPDFTDAHVARFRAIRRISALSTPERRFFLEELARRFSDSGVVTLSLLMIRGQPVAWNYGFQFRGSWFLYQATFDSRQEEHSPGHCLLSRIVIEACDMDEMNVVDLGLGAEGYKEQFGNSTRQTLHVTLTRSWPRHMREIIKYRAACRLKQVPKVDSTVRRLLGRPPA
ncbi:MAG: GNAT family N-acetyltransferase [Candidatus Sulfotelmatobacter sp.]